MNKQMMKRVKNVLSILAVMILIFSFAGCQSSGKVKQNGSSENGAAQEQKDGSQANQLGVKSDGEKTSQAEVSPSPSSSSQPQYGQVAKPTDTGKEQTSNNQASNTGNAQSGTQGGIVKRTPKDIKVKGIYMTGWTAGSEDALEHFIGLINETELNTVVLDIKDDDGYVGYKSEIPAVKEVGAIMNKYDVDVALPLLKKNNVHVVGRLVAFKDPVLSSERPDLAVKNVNGGLWRDDHNLTWLNPYNKESWPYIINIAKEAVNKGFDEIQFDYVRFPNDGVKSAMNFGPEAQTKEKYEVIDEFLAYAQKEVGDVYGVKISADIFGIVTETPEDVEDIGQYLEKVGKDIAYVSPMVYPSHYALGQIVNGIPYPIPDLDPYGVVYNSLAKAKARLSTVENYKASVRPYLQSFTASYLGEGFYMDYGPKQIRDQIKAVYDAGYEEWIFWSAANRYPESAFLRD